MEVFMYRRQSGFLDTEQVRERNIRKTISAAASAVLGSSNLADIAQEY